MLNINTTTDDKTMTIALEGRLDTETAYDLEDVISDIPEFVTELVFDMENLEYVASSGLRVLLTAAKAMNDRDGSCVMKNVPDIVSEVFEMTGLMNIFTIAE